VHFHGYPNASRSRRRGTSVAINIGGSFTYYHLGARCGTYLALPHQSARTLADGLGDDLCLPWWNRVAVGQPCTLRFRHSRTICAWLATPRLTSCAPIRCQLEFSTPRRHRAPRPNDGDGSTYYDVEYPLQIHGFDPNFHFVGMTFNPEGFTEMKDKYFLLNGRRYPDTVKAGPIETQTTDGAKHFAQPLPAIINIPVGGKALLRISDLDVTEYQTLASLGIPMKVVGYNAKLLRDQSGNNMYITTPTPSPWVASRWM
jgi:hypothetical protein